MLLRDYQIAATEAVFDYFVSSCGTPLVVLPTGSGKSICIADLVKHVLKSAPDEHCLILSHRQEILQQNAAKLQSLLPNTPIGIYSQGLGSKRLRQVTVAGVQSLVRVQNLPPFRLIIIDECFVAGTKISTPDGLKDIESLRCGDLVCNANGFGEVKGVSARQAFNLMRVEFSDGTEITCTENHKVFTASGWKEAGALEIGEIAFSEKDLCLLLERVWTLDQCQWSCNEREEFQRANMLLTVLLEEIEKPDEQSSVSIKDESEVEGDSTQAYQAWRKRAVAFFTGAGFTSCTWRGLGIECCCDDQNGSPQRDLSESLQDRHRQCGENDRDRDRWGIARHGRKEGARSEEDCFVNFPRVANLSCIKSEGARTVFNLHISGHPSYFANGKLVHNCHLVPPSGEGSYQKIISRLLAAEPDARIVGYSATPFRLGSGYLHEGEDRVFTDICFEVPVIDLVNAGYLSPLITKHANTQADLSGVAIRGGEFVAGQAEQAMDREELTGSAVAEMLRWGSERKSWLVFCSGIKHAEHVTQELIRAGVNADNLFGSSDKGHRTRVLNNFKNQRLRALVSVDTITTGFDAPCTDMIAFLRPTASAGLWVQALGRGMRISPETGKVNCVAEGQLVLTDHGMIPIEEVTLSMKLWDGCNWVSHDGVVYKGEQEVINYAGLVATADHKVWTQEGWQTFGWCAGKQITIAETGIGEQNIRQCQSRYRGDNTPHQQRSKSRIYSYVLRFLFKKDRTLLCQCNEWDSGLSKMWTCQTSSTPRTSVALQQRMCRGVSLPKPSKFALRRLWCAWNPISFCVAHGNGNLGGTESWTTSGATDRQDRQRWALRTWKPALLNTITKPVAYSISTIKRYVAHISKKLSKCKICGLHVARIFWKKNDAGRDRTSLFSSSVTQTKRRVWDILNAGPLHRFTVEGLLVSNCLVLDFCGNAVRLGPIDNPRVSQRGGSKSSESREAPSKVCPECSTCVATSTRSCVDCGYEWPEPEVIHAPVAYSSPVMSNGEPEIYEVRSVTYKKHSKNIGIDALGEDKFSYSLRVVYSMGLGFEISEWICFGHEKEFARRQADRWWKQHRKSDDSSVPKTVEEAINRTSELMDVERITVKRDGKFYRVIATTFRVSAVTESLLEEHGI